MISNLQDVTLAFTTSNGVKLDVSGWEKVTFHFVAPTGTINIQGTNDANAQTGVTDGDAYSSINPTPIQAVNLGSGTAVSAVTTTGLYQITVGCKFLHVGGASASATKVLVFMNKPY